MAAETLRPDGQLSCTGLVTCDFLEHDEDPDVSSVTINATGNNVNTGYGVDFPAPSGNPTVGADLQEFQAGVEEFDSGQTGTPTARIELWENGVLVRAGPETNVSVYAVLSFTWNANELATADGSLVQMKVIGTKSGGGPTKRNTVRIGHMEWNAEVDTSNVQTGDGSSAGVGDATADGISTAAADGSSAGVGTATGDGVSTFAGDGSSASVATVTGDGVSTFAGDGSAAGVGDATAVGQEAGNVVTGDGSSAGAAVVTGDGVSTFAGDGSSAGTGIATGDGVSTFAGQGIVFALGTVTGDGVSTFVAQGDSAGTSTATASVAAAATTGVGSSAGTSLVKAESYLIVGYAIEQLRDEGYRLHQMMDDLARQMWPRGRR